MRQKETQNWNLEIVRKWWTTTFKWSCVYKKIRIKEKNWEKEIWNSWNFAFLHYGENTQDKISAKAQTINKH